MLFCLIFVDVLVIFLCFDLGWLWLICYDDVIGEWIELLVKILVNWVVKVVVWVVFGVFFGEFFGVEGI